MNRFLFSNNKLGQIQFLLYSKNSNDYINIINVFYVYNLYSTEKWR